MSRGDCATVFDRYVNNAANSRDGSCILKDTFEFSKIIFFSIINSHKTTLCCRSDFLDGLVER